VNKSIERTLILVRNKEMAVTESELFELAYYLIEENERLEKSNRNWRRKCQRLRNKERDKNELS
jgi:hypothetical protein